MIQAHSLPLDSATSPHFNPDKKQMCRSFGGKSVFSRQRFLNPYYHHFGIAFLIPRQIFNTFIDIPQTNALALSLPVVFPLIYRKDFASDKIERKSRCCFIHGFNFFCLPSVRSPASSIP